MTETFRTDTFQKEVLESEIPVLVDFWAPWCTHCRDLEPLLEEFAENTDKIRTGKVNIDEEPALAQQYNIRSIPTVVLFKSGNAAERKTAPRDVGELEDMAGL